MTTSQWLAEILSAYTFTCRNEEDLQAQVAKVLAGVDGLDIDREVIAASGRYDILVAHDLARHPVDERRSGAVRVVLELKVSGGAAAVERQAQRYALTAGVDEVAVVTTSRRLARSIAQAGAETLGGKPFAVIALRSF